MSLTLSQVFHDSLIDLKVGLKRATQLCMCLLSGILTNQDFKSHSNFYLYQPDHLQFQPLNHWQDNQGLALMSDLRIRSLMLSILPQIPRVATTFAALSSIWCWVQRTNRAFGSCNTKVSIKSVSRTFALNWWQNQPLNL